MSQRSLVMYVKNGHHVDAVYTDLCPVCGGPISYRRLSLGLPCSSCLQEHEIEENINSLSLEERIRLVASKLKGITVYSYLSSIINDYRELERLLYKCLGKGFWSLQRTWAIRLLRGESFAITAPTGVGKTTLLLVYAIYMAQKGKKVYVLVPTENLVDQTLSKINEFILSIGGSVKVLGYKSRLSKKMREERLNRIAKLDFDILVTTTAFLSRNHDLIRGSGALFDVVIVDDADSLLKNTKNVDRVLTLLGFTEEELELAYEIVKQKIAYAYAASVKSDEAADIALRIEELSLRLNELKSKKPKGQLVIASATGRQAGLKPKLFKELLDFEVGSIQNYMRNVVDSYLIVKTADEKYRSLLDIVRRLGRGGIILVSRDEGTGEARRIVNFLVSEGIKASLAISGKRAVDKLVKGEAEVLVGVSSYYGTLVRGVDLPLHIRYVIFVGVPKTKLELRKALQNPVRVIRTAASLSDYIGKEFVEKLMGAFSRLSPSERQALRVAMLKGEPLSGETRVSRVYNLMIKATEKIYETARKLLEDREEKYLLVGANVIALIDGQLYMYIPDALSYIQASGRASRFLNNGMTLGLAVTLESCYELIESLKKRLEWYLYDFAFRCVGELDLERIKKELDISRMEGSNNLTFKPARAVLLVVESPTKAKTIASFFGRPARRRFGSRVTAYETPIIDSKNKEAYLGIIIATRGHIFDLVSEERIGLYGVILRDGNVVPVYTSLKRCLKCNEQFSSIGNKCPRCGEERRLLLSKDVALSLRALAFEVDEVLLATDPDSEGEKIAWDVYNIVAPFSRSIRRVEFHEVTKQAIIQSLRHPRCVNQNKVLSQIFRRITDRWIGFSSSEKLWETFNKHWLGSGRVQIPVLGWIIERYTLWEKSRGYVLKIRLPSGLTIKRFYSSREEAQDLIRVLSENKKMEVSSYADELKQVPPPPPLTTDELLLLSNYKLGLPSTVAMRLAQDLFESGLITYHRTDSARVSPVGIEIARHYIANVLKSPEAFVPRGWGEGGAHEAIRPTQPLSADDLWRKYAEGTIKSVIPLTPLHMRLYDLIFRRFIASQMRPGIIVETELKVKVAGEEVSLRVCTNTVSEGFTSVWPIDCYASIREYLDAGSIPIDELELSRGSSVSLYREGEIVKLMRERGIGRPSTYAKTIASLKRHGYVIESKKAKVLVPTKTGISVYEYLMGNYPTLFSEARTAELEGALREIEEGGEERLISLVNSLLEELREYTLLSDAEAPITSEIGGFNLTGEIETSNYSLPS